MSDVNENNETNDAEVFGPTYQQQVVLEGLRELFSATQKASAEHDGRAEKITAITGGIVAFLGGASALPGANIASQPLAAVSLVLVFFLSAFTVRCCAIVWGPTKLLYPTTPDASTLYDDYIKQDVYGAYNQQLVSLVSCTLKNCDAVELKAVAVDRAMRIVQLQVLAVAVTVALRALGW